MAPLFYFFTFALGPSASDLVRLPPRSRSVLSGENSKSTPLLPLILTLHTAEVLAMFLAPDLATRHYWTWAWQLTPLWITVSSTVLTHAGRPLGLGSLKQRGAGTVSASSALVAPKTMLWVLGSISAGAWAYTSLAAPHSMRTLRIPEPGAQADFVRHTRKALQADELGTAAASLLWLAYSFFDLHIAGLLGSSWLLYAASLPVVTVVIGPGAALVLGWWWRERIIDSGA